MIERTRTGYLAYIEEVPGCTRAGATLAEVARLMREALCPYFDGNPDAIPLIFRSRGAWWSVEATVPIAPFQPLQNPRSR